VDPNFCKKTKAEAREQVLEALAHPTDEKIRSLQAHLADLHVLEQGGKSVKVAIKIVEKGLFKAALKAERVKGGSAGSGAHKQSKKAKR